MTDTKNTNNTSNKRPKKKLGLTTIILLSLVLGAITGILIYYIIPEGYIRDTIIVNGVLNIVGNGFIRLMQMLVVPLVFCSLICGSMSIGDTKTMGKIGLKTVGFYLLTTILAVTLALVVAFIIDPGKGMNLEAATKAPVENIESFSIADTLLNIIPQNIFHSLASGDMLPIILFAILVGIILAIMGEKASTASNFFSQFNDLMMKMTMIIMNLAPIGVFCLIAKTFAGQGTGAILPMAKYIIAVIIGLILQCIIVYQGLFFAFTRLNPLTFFKKFFPVMTFGFSTSSSNATIPLSIDTLEKDLGVSRKISSFTVPLGATINMDGTSIMQGVAVVFIAQAYGIELTPTAIITVIATATIASIGTAGVPSVGLVTLTMVLTSVGLPTEGIAIIMGIDRILDMLRTAVNITGDAVCTTIVSKQCGLFNKEVFKQKKNKIDQA